MSLSIRAQEIQSILVGALTRRLSRTQSTNTSPEISSRQANNRIRRNARRNLFEGTRRIEVRRTNLKPANDNLDPNLNPRQSATVKQRTRPGSSAEGTRSTARRVYEKSRMNRAERRKCNPLQPDTRRLPDPFLDPP